MQVSCNEYPRLQGVLPKGALGLEDGKKYKKITLDEVLKGDFIKGMVCAAAGADVKVQPIRLRISEGLDSVRSIKVDHVDIMKLDCLHRDLVCTETINTMVDLTANYWEELEPSSFVHGWTTAMRMIHGYVTPA